MARCVRAREARSGSSNKPKNDDPLPESETNLAPSRIRIPRMSASRSERSGASSRAARSRSLARIGKASPIPSNSLDTKRKIVLLFSRGVKPCVQLLEDGGRRERPARVDQDHLGLDLPAQGEDLVPAPQTEGGAPEEEEGHVGAEAPGDGHEAGDAQPEPPHPVETHQDHGGVAASAAEAARYRDALRDHDLDALRHVRVATQEGGGPEREVRLPERHVGVVAPQDDVGTARPQDQVVVQRDRLEERAQLVVAVLAPGEDLEAEVHLGERPEAELARRAQRTLHSRRASPASTGR